MPRFKIYGASAETGADLTETIDAADPSEAEAIASHRRILVSRLIEVEASPPPLPNESSAPEAPKGIYDAHPRDAFAALCWLAVAGFMILMIILAPLTQSYAVEAIGWIGAWFSFAAAAAYGSRARRARWWQMICAMLAPTAAAIGAMGFNALYWRAAFMTADQRQFALMLGLGGFIAAAGLLWIGLSGRPQHAQQQHGGD